MFEVGRMQSIIELYRECSSIFSERQSFSAECIQIRPRIPRVSFLGCIESELVTRAPFNYHGVISEVMKRGKYWSFAANWTPPYNLVVKISNN